MASTTALFTGLSGLNAHARKLDVIGNNVANVNTTAFKSSKMMFESLFSRNFSFGSSPSEVMGGTNPRQVGNGVAVAGIQRNFNNGAFAATGDLRDMAIDGSGFFVVQREGQTYYTRAGSFRQDPEDNLITVGGERLMGFMADENFNIQQGQLVPINIPIGKRTIAEATQNAVIAGNLNSEGDIATRGSLINLLADASNGLSAVGGGFITAGTALTAIEDPNAQGSGTPAFAAGERLRLTGATKGDTRLPTAELDITPATTVQDLLDFLTAAMGIQQTGGPNPDGSTPGITVDPATGIISIVGNTGAENDLRIRPGDLVVLDAAGVSRGPAFNTDKAHASDGESVRTTMVVYDSLGASVTFDVTMVLEETPNSGPVWRYYLESEDDTDLAIALGNGLLRFNTQGQIDPGNSEINVTIDRNNTGANQPLSFSLSFLDSAGQLTSTATKSAMQGVYWDGLPPGTLSAFGVGDDGTIVGRFSNGATRTLGKVVLANFTNPEGLIDAGGNLFETGPNSGPAVVAAPGTLGSGLIIAGALEMSNVDLGEEFTQMILTSTGYSASSRVIRTADELMQQLLVLGR
ncbi:MAG: flagellar hook-basal body complex protein [Phycisphaerales bacterium]|nr:flagellar hook-basal body complex protein [Planctomycetota bacterium]MCH8508532.1 flagellar hook-basal body complex protein [Phycisphaerales bacterium]